MDLKPLPLTMSVTTEDGDRQNVFAKEPQMFVDPNIEEQMKNGNYVTHNEKAEMLNGRVAMISIMVGLASYLTTGKLFFFTW